MPLLITSDTHFTDKPRDEYRWDLFSWIKEQHEKYKLDAILFLGDLVDSKDYHSAAFTNKLVDVIVDLPTQVYILRGNHDGLDENTPFFRFLKHIESIHFILEPKCYKLGKFSVQFIPNTKNFIANPPLTADFIFVHQTFNGAISENGMALSGIDPTPFLSPCWKGRVLSGDIHVPGSLHNGKIIYCGSPYHVHFGDSFNPRVLLVNDDGNLSDLHFETIRKHTVEIKKLEDLHQLETRPGDQIKVRVLLDDLINYEEYRKEIREFCRFRGLDLYRIEPKRDPLNLKVKDSSTRHLTPADIFTLYCTRESIGPETGQYGSDILSTQVNR